MALLTPARREKRKRDAAIYREWQKLSADPKNQATAIYRKLAEKHGCATSTVIFAIRRHESLITDQTYYGDDESRAE